MEQENKNTDDLQNLSDLLKKYMDFVEKEKNPSETQTKLVDAIKNYQDPMAKNTSNKTSPFSFYNENVEWDKNVKNYLDKNPDKGSFITPNNKNSIESDNYLNARLKVNNTPFQEDYSPDKEKWMKKNGIIKEPILDDYSTIYSELDSMEERLNSSEGLEEEQIQSIKERIKNFETKLKEKVIKPKTITISNDIHNVIKNYCTFYDYKIGDWVEKTLLEKIEQSSPGRTRVEVEDAAEELRKKYKFYGTRKKMVKSDKLLYMNKNFKFIGYNKEDKPIYDYLGHTLDTDLSKIGCKTEILPEGPVYISTKYKEDYTKIDVDQGIENTEDFGIQDILKTEIE